MHDLALGNIAGPESILVSGLQGLPDRMHTGHKLFVFTEDIEHRLANTGHDAHIDYNKWRVSHLVVAKRAGEEVFVSIRSLFLRLYHH